MKIIRLQITTVAHNKGKTPPTQGRKWSPACFHSSEYTLSNASIQSLKGMV